MSVKMIKTGIHFAVYLCVRLLMCVAQSLSPSQAYALAHAAGFVMTDVLRVRRRLVEANLRRAFPDLTPTARQHLIRKMWEHLFLMGIEAALARRKIHPHNWWQHVELENIQPMLAQLNRRTPTVVVTGHFGNFEMGGFLLGTMGYPTHSVARTLDNLYLQDYVKTIREATGQFLISKNDGYADIVSVLERGGIMAFLVDQAAGPRGFKVDFFGAPASTYKAIAIFALQYNAPMVVCTSTRLPGAWMRFQMNTRAMLDPRNMPSELSTPFAVTQWYTRALEEAIRRAPDQYWWLHKRWK